MAASIYTKITIPATPNVNIAGPQVYRGFSTVNTNTNNFALYDYELIKQDLLNSFYIRQGERLMQPTIGCIIWDLLFEPLTDQIQALMTENVTQIINSDPRVQASNVVLTAYDTGIQVQFTLTYTQFNLSENIQLQFDQANGITSTALST
jgi:phage baseplate assembly protein W